MLIDQDTMALVDRLASQGIPMGNSFDVIVTDEDVRQGKPNPEGCLLAAERLETSADCLLVFEDSVERGSAANHAMRHPAIDCDPPRRMPAV